MAALSLQEMGARNKQEAQCLAYLEDHVITDEVSLL
jgi:hypothetical protein